MDDQPHTEDASAPSTRSQFFETGAFIFLILPSLLLPYFGARQLGPTFTVTAAGTILHNLAFLGLIAFFRWKNSEAWERFGWVRKQLGKEVMWGVWLFLVMSFSAILIQQALSAAGIPLPPHALPSSLLVHSPGDYVLAFLLVLVAAVSRGDHFPGLPDTAAHRAHPLTRGRRAPFHLYVLSGPRL